MLAALLAVASAQAQIYKWVDEKGRTHYEERPPEGKDPKDAKKIAAPVPSKDAKPAAASDWKQKEIEFRQREQQRHQADLAEEQKRAQREKACVAARQDLEYNEQRGRFYTTNDKG